MRLCFAFVTLLLVVPVAAQQETAPSSQPAVSFNFDWSQGIPWQTYTITVQADGVTHFQGTPTPDTAAGGDSELFKQSFTMSEANRTKIFSLAKKLNFFQGDLDSHLKRIAQTGNKTLAYQSATVHGSSSYNWSQNTDVQELTRLFTSIANTIDYGRKLAFGYRYDKLGLDAQLKDLEGLRAKHYAEELNAIEPILRKIADDPNMMNISRQVAQQLLSARNGSGQGQETADQP
ncbi:MAG: hypothetical protein WBM04_01420 [Candidatus Korobacteraceae bacterium]